MKKVILGLTLLSALSFSYASFAEMETMSSPMPDSQMNSSDMKMNTIKKAKADIINGSGKKIGTAMFMVVPGGVKVDVKVIGLKAGQHGIHIHEFGKCDTPTFTSAGEHFRPNEHKHGLKNAEGSHNGDMQNIVIDKKGKGTYMVTNKMLSIGSEMNSIVRSGGTAIVIHEKADDQKSQPSGNAGKRVACGVIKGN